MIITDKTELTILVTLMDSCDIDVLRDNIASQGQDILPGVLARATNRIGIEAAGPNAGQHALNVLQVETALCIWEWMIETHGGNESSEDAESGAAPWYPDFMRLWEAVGSSQMRMLAWQVAPAVSALYESLCAELGEDELRDVYPAYDWEFVPAVCIRLDWPGDMLTACYRAGDTIEVPAGARPAIMAEYETIKASLAVVRTDRKAKAEALAVYTAACRRAAGRAWGYPDLASDDPGSVADALAYGRTPDEWAKSAGEDADLSELDHYTAKDMARMYAEPATA